jgi:hypothetical protein
VAAFEDADPGLLKKIFGESGIAGEKEEVAVKTMLVKLDEVIEQVRIAAAEALCQGLGVVGHDSREQQRRPRRS